MSAQRASQLVEAGLWLRLSGDHEGARRLFEQALKLDPSNARARQLLESQPKSAAAAAAPPAQPPAPPPAQPSTTSNPFERKDVPGPKGAGDLDWGLATGHAPTPPPIAPVRVATPIPVRPPPAAGPANPFTVKLGDTTEPGRPPFADEVTIDEGSDPHDEPLHSTGETLSFGSNLPDAPPPAKPVESGTLVFAGQKPPQGSSTMVFGSGSPPPPPGGAPTGGGGGTLVFSGQKAPAPPPVEPGGSGTLVFSSPGGPPLPVTPASSGTMMFNAPSNAPPSGMEPLSSGTLMFTPAKGLPAAAPSGPPERGTMTFGGSKGMPPSVPPLTPYGAGARQPTAPPISDVPEIPPDLMPGPPPPSTGTLEFNFDDMVAPPKIVPPPVPPEPFGVPRTAWDKSNPGIDISALRSEDAPGGFDIISSAPPPAPTSRSPQQMKEEVHTLLSGAKDLLDLDDHTGAMELIAKALEIDGNDADALRLKDRSERTLQTMYESKLGDLNQLPRVKLKDDEIIWLNLDHRAGFVLAQIDGSVTFEDLFAVSGMSRLDTARILAQLVEEGVISKG
jgi:hypothetical protein